MPNSLVKHLQDRIADAKHDIESIEMHIVKQNESSISPDQVQGLRELCKKYLADYVVSHQIGSHSGYGGQFGSFYSFGRNAI
jgi:hypothetical protein